ncbi:putative PEP-CTERM system TPR-repeat lipoprotein [Thermoplasmatales archaeon]|nr:putative PEP-CTERM system TPR-repeat lipoprotein [Thermoplasmatales archaeon]
MPNADSDLHGREELRILIREIYSSRSRQEKESRIIDLVRKLESSPPSQEELKYPEFSQDIKKLIMSIQKINSPGTAGLALELMQIAPDDRDVKLFYSASIFNQSEPDAFVDLVYKDSDFCQDADTEVRLFNSYNNITDPAKPAVYFSMCGKYDQKMFARYLDGDLDDDVNSQIIKNFQAKNRYDDLSRFLEELCRRDKSITYLIELINAYQRTGELGKMSKVLGELNYDEIEDVDSFLILIKKSMASGNYSLASEIARHALSEYPEDHQLMTALGESLYLSDNYKGSLEVFTAIHSKFKDDYDAVRRLIDISEKLHDLNGMISWINVLCSQLICSKEEIIKKISAEIELSMFDDAYRDIREQNSPVKDVVFSKLLMNLNLKLGKVTEALNTAESILETNPDDVDAISFILRDLFDKHDYEKFLARVSNVTSNEIRSRFSGMVAASMLSTGRLDDAMNTVLSNPEVLDSEYFIDSVYSSLNKDKEIQDLTDAMAKLKAKNPLIDMVIGNLRGKRIVVVDTPPQIIGESPPLSIAAILTFDNVGNFPDVVPDVIRKFISNPKYKRIQVIVDTITEIYSGKVPKDILIFSQFHFPVVRALINSGNLERARTQLLTMSDLRNRDPFYNYAEAFLLFKEGDLAQSSKSISRAISMLSNAIFFDLEIALNLAENDEKDALASFELALAIGGEDSINFENIDLYIKKNGAAAFRDKLVEIVGKREISSVWLFRINRDKFVENKNFDEALNYSERIVGGTGVSIEDVRVHVTILDALKMGDSVIDFLIREEGKIQGGAIEVMIGDWYYAKTDYKEALSYYSEAISKGYGKEKIGNYVETLLETKNFDEARKLIGIADPNGMSQLKLYYKTGEIQKIIDLLRKIRVETKDDEERIAYVSRVLWINREVRDLLIGIYQQEGFLFLGKIISDRLIESNDFEKAIEVMKNIQKNYPDNVENLVKLSGAYEKMGKFHESIDVLHSALRHTRTGNSTLIIVDNLLRIYYQQNMFLEIRKFYEQNREFVDSTNIHFIVRSYLNLGEYDTAEAIVGHFHGSLVSNEAFNEFMEEIDHVKKTQAVMGYMDRMLKLEYKLGKKFSTGEAVSVADIPIDAVEDVFSLLASDSGYSDINEDKYEILSRDIIQKACRKTKVNSISDLSISVIYNNMARKDVIVAKNIYAYIKKEVGTVRKPRIEDQELQKLLKIALKQDVDHDPFRVACKLNTGISEAMEVIALMNYVSAVNAGGRSGNV